MLDFFKKSGRKKTNVILNLSDMNLVRETVNRNIEMVKKYYRENAIFVNKNNSMVNLINLCISKLSLPEEDYFLYFSDRVDDICKRFKFISSGDTTNVLNNILFSNSLEIFVPVESYSFRFQPDILNTCPIKLVFIEYDRLEYELYNANLDLNGKLAVFEINIPHFAMMYREAHLQGHITAPYHFINAFIYPSMLNQFINLTILNRVRTLYRSAKQQPKQKYVRYVKTADIEKRLEGVLKTYIKTCSNKVMPLDMVVDNTPTINYPLSETLRTDYNYELTQVGWIKYFITIPYARFYLDFLGQVGRHHNADKIYNMMYDLKLLRNGTYNLWRNNAPDSYVESVKTDIEYIKENYMPEQMKKM